MRKEHITEPAMNRKELFRLKSRRELGQSMVFIAIALPAFIGVLGVAMDVGNLYFNHRALQTAADASALAGATCIAFPSSPSCTAGPSTVAGNYATNNGLSSSELVPNPVASPTSDASYCPSSNCKITVSATRTVPFYFTRLVGVRNATVDVTASAIGGSINKVKGSPNLMPVGLQYSTVAGFSMGMPVANLAFFGTDACPPTCVSGDWGWLSFDATGHSAVNSQIISGYTGEVDQVAPGTTCSGATPGCVLPQPGAGESTFATFQSYRAADTNAACSVYTPCPTCPPPDPTIPCVVTVPLVDWSQCTSAGRCPSEIPVLGFAELWINSVSMGGSKSNIQATWIRASVPGGEISASGPPACAGPSGSPPCDPAAGTGAIAIQLVQ
jgi:Flp pilus assembly protein TadG